MRHLTIILVRLIVALHSQRAYLPLISGRCRVICTSKEKIKKISRLKKSVYPTKIKKMLARKSALWRACKAKKTQCAEDKYKQCSVQCSEAISAYYRSKEIDVISSNNIGSFYKYVNNCLSHKGRIPSLKRADGSMANTDMEKLNYSSKDSKVYLFLIIVVILLWTDLLTQMFICPMSILHQS